MSIMDSIEERYEEEIAALRDRNRDLPEQIATLQNQLAEAVEFWKSEEGIAALTELVHKGQGMANEINILTKENNALTAKNKRLRELCAELVGDDMKKEIE